MKSMKAVLIHEKKTINTYLQRNVALNVYSIGDLDNFFWPYTIWYGLEDAGEIKALILCYTGIIPANILALTEIEDTIYYKKLLNSIMELLPKKFYSHLTYGLDDVLSQKYKLSLHGKHFKMLLNKVDLLEKFDTSEVVALSEQHCKELLSFFKESYPGHWFDSRMLQSGMYFGIKRDNKIVSAAGIHVYSRKYKVAALGNIATHPDYRCRGLAKSVTSKLCKTLKTSVETICLNVHSENISAIKCYKALGFDIFTEYYEFMAEAK